MFPAPGALEPAGLPQSGMAQSIRGGVGTGEDPCRRPLLAAVCDVDSTERIRYYSAPPLYTTINFGDGAYMASDTHTTALLSGAT